MALGTKREGPEENRIGPDAMPTPADLVLQALNGEMPGDLPRQVVDLLRHLPVGIFVADEHGAAIHRNRVADELTGHAMLAGIRPGGYAAAYRVFRCGTDEPYPEVDLPLTRALAGEHSAAELEIEHGERGRVRLRAWAAPLRDGAGRVRCAIVAFVDVTAEKLLEDAVREQSAALERERLAATIHDDVLQLLAAARLRLSAPPRDGRPPAAADTETIGSLLRDADRQLRRILAGFRPPPRGSGTLADALLQALAPLRADGVEASLHDRLGVAVGEPAQSTLCQVGEEAIANIRKHARPHWVAVTLERDGERAAVSVVDDGVGFSPSVTGHGGGHYGVALMRERVARLGGELRIDSAPSRGTAVRAWVPDPAPPGATARPDAPARDTATPEGGGTPRSAIHAAR